MYKILFILLLLISSSFSRTIITVTHPVQEYFLKKIAEKTVFIRTIHNGNSEFDPTERKHISKYSSSNYYFTFNLEEEKNLIKLFKEKNESLKVVNLIEGIPTLKLPNGEINPYIWMDPILVRELAKNIYEELIKIRHYDRYQYKENYEKFLLELDKIFLDMKKKFDGSNLYGFFIFNNELDYFAKRFRIEVYHRENKRLNIEDIPRMIKFSRKENIHHIVIPTDSDYTIAQSFSSHISGKVVEVDIYDINWRLNLFSFMRGLIHF